jgi:hypothetical protein
LELLYHRKSKENVGKLLYQALGNHSFKNIETTTNQFVNILIDVVGAPMYLPGIARYDNNAGSPTETRFLHKKETM